MSILSKEYGLGGFKSTFANSSYMPGDNVVAQIPVDELHEFHGHPFKVLDNEDMDALVQSIQEKGVMEPINVRKDEKYGGYEIISGHRRTHACKRAGIMTVPAIILDISDDEAIIRMTDGNLHRSELLPSERARSMKMRMEAEKRIHAENGDTGYDSAQNIAYETEQSRSSIMNLIKLTCLIDRLMQMVDEKNITMTAGYSLASLSEEQQTALVDIIAESDVYPSPVQSDRIKKLASSGDLTDDNIRAVLTGGNVKQHGKKEKKPEITGITFKGKQLKTIRSLFPECTNEKDLKDAVLNRLCGNAGSNAANDAESV